MSIDASAKNMQAVCKAKEQHDKTCPWGGKGTEVHMNWFDIDRIGWDEGDGGGRSEEEEVETVEAVAAERELQPVGPSLN